MREFGVQTREVNEAAQDWFAKGGSRAIRMALITSPSILQQMQTRRVTAVEKTVEVFASAEDAMNWLQKA